MEITVCRSGDVALLDRYLGSPGATSFRARRFARQEAGECTYLVAWLDGRPVGHTELRWIGCAAPEVTLHCPEIGGLAVWPEELRSRGIGTELIRAAEELARERGLTTVGIGVGKDNPRAAALYARLGYRPVTDYLDRYTYEDHDGTIRECVDACVFLVRELPSGRLDVKRA
ncbi:MULTISPECIES: GNAT family N-acetyltransferase [Streptomyces]|uniref:Acetyltransferase n=1 Tax=Streptomyces sviceus (strain ATCC 29083 / DSM 924 / JCM 4929 / NBRC 13980 / NCIMB 11184 / NRRL 5439 / UC 5370) TaxID=463191 RepID=B5I3D7_STRX2|nr:MULTISPECIES: GNAT family N-acetyltransferase [Streptomyces]EDY59592.1 acetyltransferase [Streptomyces sviceus ATCC 29083]MYT04516.1 GNAT family N-acetyltransferase [Streptomyces sp. SID5470]